MPVGLQLRVAQTMVAGHIGSGEGRGREFLSAYRPDPGGPTTVSWSSKIAAFTRSSLGSPA